jgi:hypothetical protein
MSCITLLIAPAHICTVYRQQSSSKGKKFAQFCENCEISSFDKNLRVVPPILQMAVIYFLLTELEYYCEK